MQFAPSGCNHCPQTGFDAVRSGSCPHCGSPHYTPVYSGLVPAALATCDCYTGFRRITKARGDAQRVTVLEYA